MKRTSRGFTLIEICIVLAIAGIVMGPLFLQQQKLQARYEDLAGRNAARQEADAALARMAGDLAAATRISVPPHLDGFTTGAVRWSLHGGRLLRNGRSVLRESRAADFIAWRNGSDVVVTLDLARAGFRGAPEVRWKAVRSIPLARRSAEAVIFRMGRP